MKTVVAENRANGIGEVVWSNDIEYKFERIAKMFRESCYLTSRYKVVHFLFQINISLATCSGCFSEVPG